MKLYPDKLNAHLAKTTAPVYFLHGDEPLQLMELGDRLRLHAKDQGFAERQVIMVTEDADWAAFREAADSLSLFAERRLIELRLPSGKPGRVGAEVLKNYCANAPADVLLIISSGRLDRSGSNSAWFKAIDKVGVTMSVWPITGDQLKRWLSARLSGKGLQARPEALALISERVEGNLLAASQEIERLALLYPAGVLEADQIIAAVADSARYSIGDLSQAALEGQSARALRILRGLHDEAVSEVLVLWSLSQEIRAATRAAEAHAQGMGLDAALKGAGVWQNRSAALKLAMARHSERSWLEMLSATAVIDRQIKGQAAGSAWNGFAALCTCLAGSGERVLPEGEALL
ncbi:MAG: DNA polymerase III subunit delta [Granulosicoccus sp.]